MKIHFGTVVRGEVSVAGEGKLFSDQSHSWGKCGMHLRICPVRLDF